MLKEVLLQIELREEYIADNGHAPRDETITTKPQMYASSQVNVVASEPVTRSVLCESVAHSTGQCNLDGKTCDRVARSKRLCIGCLEHGHVLHQCTNQSLTCAKCSGHHWAVMCSSVQRRSAGPRHENKNRRQWHADETPRQQVASTSAGVEQTENATPTNSNATVNVCQIGVSQHQTCLARVNGQVVRVAFDSCAGHSFNSASMALWPVDPQNL